MHPMLRYPLASALLCAAAAQADTSGSAPVPPGQSPLFARVMHVQTQPGQMDAVSAIYRDAVVPSLQQQPGFKGTWLLTDPASNKGMSITLWDSDSARQNADRQVMDQVKKVAPLLAAPPVAEAFLAHNPG